MSDIAIFTDDKYKNFFRPFCGKNALLYYECITALIEKSETLPLLYESDAKDILTLYFRNCKYAIQDDTEQNPELNNTKSESENAAAVLRYFRKCGWVSDNEMVGRRENTATVSSYCRELIRAIDNIFNRKNNAVLTNSIFAVHDVLRAAFTGHERARRPYSNILMPVMESIDDLRNEILSLQNNIHIIMRLIIEQKDLNTLGQLLIKDKLTEDFFNDYFFLKKDGTISSYVTEIQDMLISIKNTDVYQKIILEYEKLNDVSNVEAAQSIDAKITSVQSFLAYDYTRGIEYIESKINAYYELLYMRFYMISSGTTNLQSLLDRLLMQLKTIEPDKRNIFLKKISNLFNLYSFNYISSKAIARRKKSDATERKGEIKESSLSDKEKRLQTEELYNYSDEYDVEKVKEYFDNAMQGKTVLYLNDMPINTKRDAFMAACCGINSSDPYFPFKTVYLDSFTNTAVADMRNMKITRKKA